MTTTYEQSKRLLACGISPDTADMSLILETYCNGRKRPWIEAYAYSEGCQIHGYGIKPLWTLSALLDILPEDIDGTPLIMARSPKGWIVGYKGSGCTTSDLDVIEACIKLIEQLHKYKMFTPENEIPHH